MAATGLPPQPMHRFHLTPEQCHAPTLTLTDAEAHHARQVLRVRTGDRVAVLDGAGHEYLCEVTDVTRHAVVLRARQRHDLPALPYRLTLFQAVTKSRSMDLIVQKATELGAHRIVPVLSERSVVQWSAEDAPRKTGKWQAVAVEAIKQCGAPWLPIIETPATLQAVLARNDRFDLMFLASLQPGNRHPRECFATFSADHGRAPTEVAVWIGPEGDFTPAELSAILSSGALPITLGPLVLRSETAAIYCLSFLSYELQRPVLRPGTA